MCIQERKTAAKLVSACSGFAIAVTVYMFIQTMTFANKDAWDLEGVYEEAETARGGGVMLLLLFSVFGFFFGIMGVLTLCCKNRIYAMCLSALLLVVWVVMLIVSAGMYFFSTAAKDVVTQVCGAIEEKETDDSATLEAGAETTPEEDTSAGAEAGAETTPDAGDETAETDDTDAAAVDGDAEAADAGDETVETADDGTTAEEDELSYQDQAKEQVQDAKDDAFAAAVTSFEYLNSEELNTFMCSKYCPCPDVGESLIGWIDLPMDEVLARNRVATWNDGVTPEPWVFGGLIYNVKASADAETPVGYEGYIYPATYSNFEACVNDAITREDGSQVLDADFITIAESFQPGGANEDIKTAVAMIEEAYTCSGSCDANLFYFTQDVTLGIPDQACTTPVIEDFSGILGTMGMAGTVSALLLLCSWFWSYCLWKKFDEE